MEQDFSYQFYRTTTEAWDAMYQVCLGAQKSIYWELYVLVDDIAGAKFIDLLCQKARAGVDVKLVLDGLGSYMLSSLGLARLRGCGVDVQWFNKLYPEWRLGSWFTRVWYRNHRKVLIVDEEIAFLGGVNVSVQFGEWNDIHLKLSGRVVRPLLRSFAKSYIRCGGNRKNVRHLLHPKLTKGLEEWRNKFKFIMHSPLCQNFSPVRRLYWRGLSMAKESFNLLSPYYVPDRKFLTLVSEARSRGVKVNIYLPLRSDHWFMESIAKAYYGLTHRAGATIHLLRRMHHGKAMTSDKTSGFVGSVNFTPRSFFLNEESGVQFTEEKMVNELNCLFENLKTESEPLDFAGWQKRGWWSKTKEWWAKKMENYV